MPLRLLQPQKGTVTSPAPSVARSPTPKNGQLVRLFFGVSLRIIRSGGDICRISERDFTDFVGRISAEIRFV